MNIIIPKNCWLSSQLSIARHYGGCKADGHEYVIVPGSEDLVRTDWLPVYKKVGPQRTNELCYDRHLSPKEALAEISSSAHGDSIAATQLSFL